MQILKQNNLINKDILDIFVNGVNIGSLEEQNGIFTATSGNISNVFLSFNDCVTWLRHCHTIKNKKQIEINRKRAQTMLNNANKLLKEIEAVNDIKTDSPAEIVHM